MRADHLEIEHKFLVPDDFDAEPISDVMASLGAAHDRRLTVRDTYFWRPDRPEAVFRHRIDAELHQLTVKSGSRDAEVRAEVDLDLAGPDAVRHVEAFLTTGLGPCQRLALTKSIRVWEPPGFEVVHYVARRDDGRTVRCVEFECVDESPPEQAVEALRRLEVRCGFQPDMRCPTSLFQLMTASDAEFARLMA